jgi:hypothetical protein
MIPVGRVSDIGFGTCYLHDHPVSYVTTITSGVSSVLTNNLQTAVVSSIGCASCGHTTIALTGSGDVAYENLPVHRVGDIGTTGAGTYTLITGSSDTYAN